MKFQKPRAIPLFLTALLLASPALPKTKHNGTGPGIRLYKMESKGQIFLCAANEDLYAPEHLKVEFLQLANMKFSAPLPVTQVLAPNQNVTLGFLSIVDVHQPSRYEWHDSSNLGDPNAVPDKDFAYLFPYGHGVKHEVTQGYFGQVTHQSCYCLDFDLKEGSPVCAAREGVVVRLKQDSNVGGLDPSFKDKGNYIAILHSDGTWAQYGHLQLNGAQVRLGQRVKAGQVIALSGHTGEAKGPHLHFQVNQASWEGENPTLPTKFLGKDGALVSAEEGKFYYSYHPGEPAFKEINAADYDEARLDQVVADTPRDGAVTIKSWPVDDRTLFYCANGTSGDKTVTLRFPLLQNYTCSKPLPCTKTVPAGKMVYFLSLQKLFTYGNCQYRYQWSWR